MIIFLVEDYSMRKFLEGILPRLGFTTDTFEIKHHNGKEDLLGKLDQVIPSLSKRAKHLVTGLYPVETKAERENGMVCLRLYVADCLL